VSIHLVAVRHELHTCPAEAGPHPWSTTRTVLQMIPGRSCLTPVTIRSGDVAAVVACGRHDPADKQCRNCRAIITHPLGGQP
jgi:hypothetical protein